MSSPIETHKTLREELLSAAEHRAQQEGSSENIKYLAHIHEVKQAFRRLIDPGIMRPNNRETAVTSLKTLATLSDNLLRDPDNPKFQQFKPTNDVIKKRLVDVKGALEYAVALGFHLKVIDFQPLYVFNGRRHLEDLHVGNEILKETLVREAEKQDRSKGSKLSEKELQEIVRHNVQLNFQEDRRMKQLRDEREAALRAARQLAGASSPAVAPTSPAVSTIPTGGVTLSGHVEPSVPVSIVGKSEYEEEDDDE
ncbi:hypothetical protein DFH11DRAFT_1874689 [Phellopilus nigrolimitatus]|nr:hypothetical protein DFH11DRAFT_1874689 [Phellopilus nigrolimitatus]